jgi:AAA+ superfamily predicted ATPase
MSRELWSYQEYAVNKYKDREYFGLLFPTGTGKTRTAIAIAEEKDMPVLIMVDDPPKIAGRYTESKSVRLQIPPFPNLHICSNLQYRLS